MKKDVHLNVLFLILALILLFSLHGWAAQVHRVKPDESIYTIARQYGVTANEVIAKNNLRSPDDIFIKEVLIIPDRNSPGIYRVQTGDTLYKISQKLGIPLKTLASINGLSSKGQLYVRQVLYIPYRYRFPQTYTVKPGDTLYNISSHFGLTVDEIVLFNNINKGNNLEVGQTLKIPALPPRQPDQKKSPQYTSLFPDTFYLNGSTGSYKIALTFDDGPDKIYTPRVLDVLDRYNVPATFFLMGNRVEKYPEVVKQIEEEGHLIANHTWSHANLTKISEDKLAEELLTTEAAVENITNQKTSLSRPPEGAVSEDVIKQLKELNYRVIFWSVDSRDWLSRNVDQILINTLPNIRKDSIILFHSAGGKDHDLSATVEVLPELIETLRMRGFTFVNLDELLSVPAYKVGS